MKKIFIISSMKQYHETMAAIFELMNRGEANLTKSERMRTEQKAKAAERYEDEILGLRLNSFRPSP